MVITVIVATIVVVVTVAIVVLPDVRHRHRGAEHTAVAVVAVINVIVLLAGCHRRQCGRHYEMQCHLAKLEIIRHTNCPTTTSTYVV